MRGKLYLVRHGESMGNVWPEAYKSDSKNFLSPYGVMQAKLTGAYFKRMGITFNTVVSSDKTRARHTMATILHEMGDWQRSWKIVEGLNELHNEKSAYNEHGDDPTRVYESMAKIFENWVEGDLLIVSHYHVMREIFHWLNVTPKNIDSFEGRHIGNAQPFMYTPGTDRIVMLDLTQLGAQH